MRCPICKEEIEDKAKICKHCGSYTKRGWRIWGVIKSALQVATFIAAILVLYFMWQNNLILQSQIEELSKQFIEEKRPKIEIATPTIEFSDTGLVIHIDIYNEGFADAGDLSIYLMLQYEDFTEDTLAYSLTHVSRLSTARKRSLRWSVGTIEKANLLALADVRYTWVIQNLDYKEKKFFHYIYDERNGKYIIRVLMEEQIEKFWGDGA